MRLIVAVLLALLTFSAAHADVRILLTAQVEPLCTVVAVAAHEQPGGTEFSARITCNLEHFTLAVRWSGGAIGPTSVVPVDGTCDARVSGDLIKVKTHRPGNHRLLIRTAVPRSAHQIVLTSEGM